MFRRLFSQPLYYTGPYILGGYNCRNCHMAYVAELHVHEVECISVCM